MQESVQRTTNADQEAVARLAKMPCQNCLGAKLDPVPDDERNYSPCSACQQWDGKPTGRMIPELSQGCENCDGGGTVRMLDKHLPADEYRKQVEAWQSTSDLSVCPTPDHPDDYELYCGGTGRVHVSPAEALAALVQRSEFDSIQHMHYPQEFSACWDGMEARGPTPLQAFARAILGGPA